MTDCITRAFLAAHAPVHASLSPDGLTLAVTRTRVPDGTEDEQVDMTFVDIASGRETSIPNSRDGDRLAQWSPDGRSLALLTDTDDTTTLVVSVPETGERQMLSATRVEGPPAWSPDSRQIVVPARRGIAHDRSRPYRWTRPYPAADGIGPLEDPPQLLVVPAEPGAARWLTDDGWRWSMPRWAPSGDKLAAVAGVDPTDRVGGQALRLIDLDGRVDEPALPGGRAIVPCWLDDGTLVVLVAEPESRPAGSEAELYVIADGAIQRVPVIGLLGDVFGDCAAELADTYDNVLLGHGRSVALRTGSRGRMGIALINVDDGEVRTAVDGPRACSPVALAADTLVFTRQAADLYPELATIDLAIGPDSERTLVSHADHLPRCADVERLVVASPDGWDLDVWFLSSSEATRPLPTVVVVHGGPHFAYGEAFSLDAQALCAAGLGVLYTNPRGSTGYGDDFAHAVHGDWASGPSGDVLAVVEAAVARGWADARHLGITGNSYGGYLAAWLASTTDRFAAAVIENPVTDLLGMYGTSDIGRRFFPAQLGGPPHEKIDVYVSQSPLLQAHHCRTPCLFVTGELDRRCPPGQAWAMHRVLCEVGTPSEVLVLPGSSHEGTTYGPPSARIAHNEALVGWMTRWLCGDAEVPS